MPNPKPESFNNLIDELIGVWADWMKNHNRANDSSLSFAERRGAGERCEKLQEHRRHLIISIDECFNRLCSKNE